MNKKRTEKPVGEKGQGEAITGLSVEVLEYLTRLSVSERPKQIEDTDGNWAPSQQAMEAYPKRLLKRAEPDMKVEGR